MLKRIFDFIIEIVYPRKCVFCGEIFKINEPLDEYICFDCYQELTFIHNEKNCDTFVLGYDDLVKKSIHKFKYDFHPHYAKTYAKLISSELKNIDTLEFDFIVPVPMYSKKRRTRGFNQAELIGIEISNILGIPVITNEFKRIKPTKPQSLIASYSDRRKNLKGAFRIVEKGFFEDKSIMLVDDIITSGATIKECKNLLYEDGAKNIIAVSLACAGKYKSQEI